MIQDIDLPVFLAAVHSSHDGITITDAQQPDMPLVFVSEGFSRMTGYSWEEISRKNCRFLQGPDTSEQAIGSIRSAIKQRQSLVVELKNYRKNGEGFWNRLSLTPIISTAGELTHYIGVQHDVTAEKEKSAIELELRDKSLKVAAALEAQERERKHIGGELHDNINQLLAAARLHLNVAATDAERQIDMIKTASEIVTNAINEVRKLSHRLVGVEPAKFSLVPALEELVQNLEVGDFNILVSWGAFDQQKIPETKSIAIYRVIQEQLSNIMKHARAQQVEINFEVQVNTLEITVKDNGIGFDTRIHSQGIGLRSMEARLEKEGGGMAIESKPGLGTTFIAWLPMKD